jgi:hypothetical protein
VEEAGKLNVARRLFYTKKSITHIKSSLIFRRVKADFPKNLDVNRTDCDFNFPKPVRYCFADARIVRKCRHFGGLANFPLRALFMMNNQREFPRLRICLWNFGKAS